MASPLASAKQSVSLASPSLPAASARGSKIRRDPPPAAKEIAIPDSDQRDTQTVVLGLLTVTLVLIIIAIGLSSALGWSPRDYVAHF